MRELFDRLLAEGEAGIDRLVAERTQESVTLDFKEARGAPTGTLANEDRKTFAKALSAFANSAGGLLVFGVEARKGADDVDCAQAAKPIANIARFKSEATTASGQLLQPRHDGIVVEAIASLRQPGAGYLLVHVEQSERRPHRSEAAGQKQYFKRAGDSSFEMEHYDIESMFRVMVIPELSLTVKVFDAHMSASTRIADLQIYVSNPGRVTAKDTYIQLMDFRHCIHDAQSPTTFQRTLNRGLWSYWSGANTPMHPSLDLYVTTLRINVSTDLSRQRNVSFSDEMVEFEWRMGCENMPQKIGRFRKTALGSWMGDEFQLC